MRYPVPGYAVEHQRGVVLFDTGLHDTLMTSTDELGGLARCSRSNSHRTISWRFSSPPTASKRRITHVVNSHLHFDHCGRNGPFAGASTLVQSTEWEAAHHRGPTTYVGTPLDEIEAGTHRAHRRRARRVRRWHGGVCSDARSHGRTSVVARAAIRQPDTDTALLVGDACYLRQMLTDGILPPFAHDADRQRQSYESSPVTSGTERDCCSPTTSTTGIECPRACSVRDGRPTSGRRHLERDAVIPLGSVRGDRAGSSGWGSPSPSMARGLDGVSARVAVESVDPLDPGVVRGHTAEFCVEPRARSVVLIDRLEATCTARTPRWTAHATPPIARRSSAREFPLRGVSIRAIVLTGPSFDQPRGIQ